MNPFENDNINDKCYIPKEDTNIEIWNEVRGRKSDTYITGLPLSREELMSYLKQIKKSKGCNGSIKESLDENNNDSYIFHLQGNHINYLMEFFKEKEINNIKLKG